MIRQYRLRNTYIVFQIPAARQTTTRRVLSNNIDETRIYRLLRECEDDAGRKVCAVCPAGACGRLKMESHAADLELDCHRIIDRDIDTRADPGGERTRCAVPIRGRLREISDADTCQSVGRNI